MHCSGMAVREGAEQQRLCTRSNPTAELRSSSSGGGSSRALVVAAAVHPHLHARAQQAAELDAAPEGRALLQVAKRSCE